MPHDFVRLRTALVALGMVFGPSPFAGAQPNGGAPIGAGVAEPANAMVVKMTLHPARAPVPALKYHLLPEVSDLKPGNAALLYQRAHSMEWWGHFNRTGEAEKNYELLEMPLKKMPRGKVVLIPGALKEMDLAARREFCDWELTPRLRDEGYWLLLPDMQGFRVYGQMLALRARLDMLDGKFDQAVVDLQTGFALGRHVGEAPIVISSLVGMAISTIMLNQVEEFVQLDKAPNLYWALADLPHPLIDLRRALQGEKVFVSVMFADIRAALKDPNQPPIPLAILKKYLDNLEQVGGHGGTNLSSFRLTLTALAARAYPAAKKYLLANRFSAEQVEALPVTQVSLMYAAALFDEAFDETYKWQGFPYWQARSGLAAAGQRLRQMFDEQPEASLLTKMLLPALERVMFAKVRLERRVALLQIVEALRLYAASAGKLPARLDDMRAVPIPVDPVTGKAFEYTLTANHAVLYGPPPTGETASEHNAVRYEVTLAPPTMK